MDKAVIVDIDGTLAKRIDRSPYCWSLVDRDKVKEPVAELVRIISKSGIKIVIVTGRDGSCKEKTIKWLKDNDIPFDDFYIRETGNNEKDSIIKKSILDCLINKYNILFVLDDRDQVVKMWRENGLTCLQVDYGEF
jgi:3-deoxy-D-manno-octulosonate 8-phosphate phosphatase KdsC-like HAD superfamily phosphatase